MITCGRATVIGHKTSSAASVERSFRKAATSRGHEVVRVIGCYPIGDNVWVVTANMKMGEARHEK